MNKEEIGHFIPHVLDGIVDRNADVRKAASEVVLPFMCHLGYEGVVKHASRIKVRFFFIAPINIIIREYLCKFILRRTPLNNAG